MNHLDPYLRELSEDLSLVWQSNSRKLMQTKIDDLSQTNQLQLGLADRLISNALVQLKLISGEYLTGKVICVGTDAVLISTSLTVDLVPTTSLVSVSKLDKAKSLNQVQNQLLLPTLIKHIESMVVIQSRSNEVSSGQLMSVWRDCFDVMSDNGLVTFLTNSVLKLSLINAQ